MIRKDQFNHEMKSVIDGFWKISNSARGEMSVSPLYVLLYLLSGYKDGLFFSFENRLHEKSFDLSQEVKMMYRSDNNYIDINSFYESLMDQVHSKILERIFKFFLQIDKQFLKENFAVIFDSILSSSYDRNDGGHGGNFQPLELNRLLIKLGELSNDAKVYNPFAGLASLATLLKPSQNYFGQEINTSYWVLGKLRLSAHDSEFRFYANEDSINSWDFSHPYDLIIASSPFRPKISTINNDFKRESLNELIIKNGLQSLSENGKLIVIFPQSFFFSSSSRDQDLRKWLVKSNLIETIVSLPNRILPYAAVNTSILVIRKNQSEKSKIRMIDASSFVTKSSFRRENILDDENLWTYINSNNNSEFVRYIDKKRIQDEDFNLQVSRYFIDENINGVKFGEFATIINGTTVRTDTPLKVVKIKDLKSDPFNSFLDNSTLAESIGKVGVIRKIEQSCLLVAANFTSLKPTYFKFEGLPIYISNHLYALNIDESRCNIRYLIYALHSAEIVQQIQNYTAGQILPKIGKKDLLNLKIELPSLQEQNNLYIELAQKQLSAKSAQYGINLQEQIINVNDENSFLRHQIAGSLKNVRSAFDFVQKILAEKVSSQLPELYGFKADERLSSTLNTYLKIIETDLKSINRSVNKIGGQIDLMDMHFEEFDVMEFLQNYAESLRVRGYNFYEVVFNFDEEILDEENVKKVFVRGDKDFLRKAFDNIVENAEKHAFDKLPPNTNKMWIYPMFNFEDMNLQIDFANTGNRLPENMTYDSMVRKGSSVGKNAGEGIGMWYVREVMKLHDGEFGFTDETGSEGIGGEYVTSIELILPIIEVNENV